MTRQEIAPGWWIVRIPNMGMLQVLIVRTDYKIRGGNLHGDYDLKHARRMKWKFIRKLNLEVLAKGVKK